MLQVSSFAKQPAGSRVAAFVSAAPGSFVAASERAGVLQTWNVSQPQPLHLLNTGLGGITSLAVLPNSHQVLLACRWGLPRFCLCSLASSGAAHLQGGFDSMQQHSVCQQQCKLVRLHT